MNSEDPDDPKLQFRISKKSGSLEDQNELMKELVTYLEEALVEEEED